MWARLIGHWRQRREDAAVARRAIPDALWRRTLKRFPFLPPAGSQDDAALRRMSSLFLDRKEFTGAHGLVVTDDMAVAIAAQACLPVLSLGLPAYDGFVGIVVHPGLARVRRQFEDEDGVVHEQDETLSGEAVQGGPVMLSWRDVRSAGAKASHAYNVVIHEFAHVLDMADGMPDGVPLLPASINAALWQDTFASAYERFCTAVDADEPTQVDPYGAQSPDEFFAVATEAFFVAPAGLQAEHPQVYDLLQRYFQQDPLTRLASAGKQDADEP
jgi:Mlc titration factor MtfA (ptsG expression regulator)